jgi:predicted AlkP superfamily pyrophosphatase or phosphodiesterase
MKRVLSLAAVVLSIAAFRMDRRPGEQPNTRTVVLIGVDALRWDFVNRPGAVNLRRLAERGTRSERLVPSFPSKTFPNFYTLVTGLHTQNHGIVANTMLDSALGWFRIGNDPAVRMGAWYGGEPIWVTAQKEGQRSAVNFWPGTEAEIKGMRPTWFAGYQGSVPHGDRVFRVLEWLAMPAATRPQLVTVYFEDVDAAAHAVGPMGARTDSAIAKVDSAIGAILDGVERLGRSGEVDFVVVSDHGMAQTSPDQLVYLDDYVSLDSVDVIDWTPVAMIRPRAGKLQYALRRLRGAHPNLQVYAKAQVPARLNFSTGARITPIVAIADEGWTITTRARAAEEAARGWFSYGAHGYDNTLPSMGGTLIASGPHVRRGAVVPAIGNIHVYPLLAALLGVTPARSDGSSDSIRVFLAR